MSQAHLVWNDHSSKAIDFALWVLTREGVTAGPFTGHTSERDEPLRLGMTGAEWLHWFDEVVRLETRLADPSNVEQLEYLNDPPSAEEQRAMMSAILSRTPPAVWEGSEPVGEALRELWQEFTRLPTRRRMGIRWRRNPGEPPLAPSQKAELELGNLVRETAVGLARLQLFGAAYPGRVMYVVPPCSIVFTCRREWSWDRYSEALIAGVQELVRAQGLQR